MNVTAMQKSRLSARELRQCIWNLKRISLDRAEVDFLKIQLGLIFHRYGQIAPVVGEGEIIYRAVIWSEKPKFIIELGYPPVARVNTFQRVNRPHSPMFYGSVGCASTLFEVGPKIGDRLALSKWRVKKEFNAVSFGYTEEIFRKAGVERWPQVWWAGNRQNDSEFVRSINNDRENIILRKFLAEEFTKKVLSGFEWQYKLSVAIAEIFLNANKSTSKGCDGVLPTCLVYPSVAHMLEADNLALKPETADNNLELVSVQYIEISNKDETTNQFHVNGLDFAETISETGQICWKNSFPVHLLAGTDIRLEIDNGGVNFVDPKWGSFGWREQQLPFKLTNLEQLTDLISHIIAQKEIRIVFQGKQMATHSLPFML